MHLVSIQITINCKHFSCTYDLNYYLPRNWSNFMYKSVLSITEININKVHVQFSPACSISLYSTAFEPTWSTGYGYILVMPAVIDPPGFPGTGLDGGFISVTLQVIHPDGPPSSSICRSSQHNTSSIQHKNKALQKYVFSGALLKILPIGFTILPFTCT